MLIQKLYAAVLKPATKRHSTVIEQPELAWLKFIRNPMLWWQKRPESSSERSTFLESLSRSIMNALCMDVSLSYRNESYERLCLPLRQDSYVKCMAPHRSRSRHGNTGSSGNIGVMTKLREEGWFEEACEIVDKMDKQGMEITSNVLLCLLQEAITRKNLEKGRDLHRLTKSHNLESDIFIGTFLIRLYTTCGCLSEAIESFHKATDRSVFTWSAMIAAHAKLGKGEDGLAIFREMLRESDLKPEENVLVATLEACARIPSIDEGKQIHKYITENNHGTNAKIGSALIDMYTKCGSLEEARKVFDRLPKRELVVWNAMIISYSHFRRVQEAIRLVQLLQQERLKPNDDTYLSLLQACASIKDLERCKKIHNLISQNNYDGNSVVANSLMNMYAKCGSWDGLHAVFNKLRIRDATNWNTFIMGHIELGDCSKALSLAAEMQREATGLKDAFVSLLRASIGMSALTETRRLHALVLGSSKPDPFVGCTLIDLYCQSDRFKEACKTFDTWPNRTLEMWNSMIDKYVEHGHCQKAQSLCKQMIGESMKPAAETLLNMLKNCNDASNLEMGRKIHSLIQSSGQESDPIVQKALMEMYERCGDADEAQKLLVVS